MGEKRPKGSPGKASVNNESLTPLLPFAAEKVAQLLLDWYGQAGRDLPWRQTRDPYRIWLAEIMLQQTTVTTAIGYYQRFLESFPTLEQLAAAPQEQVIDLWAGLGYYVRARNLHAAAQVVVHQLGGLFPADVAGLMQLPGIGRSTAGAVAALAFEQAAPILDGNVRRILCRLFALQEAPHSRAAEKKLWLWAEALTPEQRVHDYTQAIMDLGALVCLPRHPLCPECPLKDLCQARSSGLEQQLPLKQPQKQVPQRHALALLIQWQGRYLVQRRPARGFLGGLWEFPTLSLDGQSSVADSLARLMADYAVQGKAQALGRIKHVYSHFRLELQLFRVPVAGLAAMAETDGRSNWYTSVQLETLALHGAHKKALEYLGE